MPHWLLGVSTVPRHFIPMWSKVGLFEAKNNQFDLFLIDWPRNLLEFIMQLAFLKVYRSLYNKIKIFPFLKQRFGIFQIQAPGNPDVAKHRLWSQHGILFNNQSRRFLNFLKQHFRSRRPQDILRSESIQVPIRRVARCLELQNVLRKENFWFCEKNF